MSGQYPVSGASIVLRLISGKKENDSIVISDSTGLYQFTQLLPGRYLLSASHIGFAAKNSDTVVLLKNNSSYAYDIIMHEDSTTLQNVTVKSKQELVQMDKGKLIFDVQKLTTTSGLTAFDILKKMPGITTDQDESLMLRGSAGINVLVNGKMTYLSGIQLTTYLKSISAEDIGKIELNATPSAQFDAAGNGGIINIQLQKKVQPGYALDLRSGITKGKYWMANENLSASYRARTFSVYGSFDFKMPNSYSIDNSGNIFTLNGETVKLSRTNWVSMKTNYRTWRAGGEWKLLPKHGISFDYMHYLDDWYSNRSSDITIHKTDGSISSLTKSVSSLTEPYYYDAANFSYRFDIDTTGKNLTAEAHYISYKNYSDSRIASDYYDADANFTGQSTLLLYQPGFIKIKSVKADVELPFSTFTFKSGLKYTEAGNDNQYQYDSLKEGSSEAIKWREDHFRYRERIAAAYISGAGKINKTSLEAGVRAEYTKADAQIIVQQTENRWQYLKWFPNLSVEQQLTESDKIGVSASRRINRPAYSELNPVRWYFDPYFYFSGTPYLVPELSWVVSSAYTWHRKYVATVTYNYSHNYINRRLSIDEEAGAIKSQAANFSSMHRIDVLLSVPVKIASFWSMQLLPDVAYMIYPISMLHGERQLSKWFVTASAQQDISLPGGFKINVSSQYFSRALRGIYVTKGYFFTDVGCKKSFFSNKLDAQVSFSDIFHGIRYTAASQSDITNYYYNEKPDTRRAGLTLHYHFGGSLVRANNRTTEEQDRL